MQYLTGRLAFAIPCKLDSCGIWNISIKEFQNPDNLKMAESDESIFKDWGIEQNKLVPGREFCSYNVANHLRAYVDMLMSGDLDQLVGIYDENNKLTEKFKMWLDRSDNKANRVVKTRNAGGMSNPVGQKGKVKKIFKALQSDKGYVRIVAERFHSTDFDIKIPPYKE